MKVLERIETERLVLRRPRPADAEAIFDRYASDPEVTRFLAWPLHENVAATRAFLAFSDAEWQRWPAGPYLVEDREDGRLLGSTGLAFKTPDRASTGYVFAKDAWGKGYATEALVAMVGVARDAGVTRLCAFCHVDHAASRRVLEKCGFRREGSAPFEFPNLPPDASRDAYRYARTVGFRGELSAEGTARKPVT